MAIQYLQEAAIIKLFTYDYWYLHINLLENLNTCIVVRFPMNRQVFHSQTKVSQKLHIQYEDLYNSDKISSVSYLLKFEDSSVLHLLAVRPFVCEMQLHSQWKYYLVMQLKSSRCFRIRFFCWVLAMLQKTEGTIKYGPCYLIFTPHPLWTSFPEASLASFDLCILWFMRFFYVLCRH